MPAYGLCVDCKTKDGSHEIRRRRLCSDCLIRYVNSKVLKRMESYRFRNLTDNAKKRLLLPLSGGVSSLALLQILDTQLKKQVEKQNRTAYDLVLVHVQPPEVDTSVSQAWREQTTKRFSSHLFLPSAQIHEVLSSDTELETDLRRLNLRRARDETDQDFYISMLSSTSSLTTRADLHELLLRRLLINLAKQQKCESILWGHCDTKLAASALANVAKGRGGSVPGEIADGPTSYGLTFNHPMRDLFKSEIELYSRVLQEPLETMIMPRTGHVSSTKNTTINDLLSAYISSQGERYPSIIGNVVRTTSKLQVSGHAVTTRICPVCRQPIGEAQDPGLLCYGCERIREDIKITA